MEKSVLITGGAGGLGGAASRFLADKGWHVYVADFSESALEKFSGDNRFTPVQMDVTSSDSVAAALQKVKQTTSRLDGIVNFAGILVVGSLIEVEEKALQRVLEVNVLGTYRVNKIFFPLIKNGQGRIINISSETGWQSGAPFGGPYAMSKHAIECYSDSLRRELSLFGIPVIKIQPGPFKTDMVASIERNFEQAANASTYFKDVLERLKGLTLKEQEKASHPDVLAEVVYRALTVRRPRVAYSVKPDPARAFLDKLPTRLVDRIFYQVLRSGKKSQ